MTSRLSDLHRFVPSCRLSLHEKGKKRAKWRKCLILGSLIITALRHYNWFNKAAFAVPAPFTWGNLGRYIGFGPQEWEGELGLSKRTLLTEHYVLNFRAEAFNLFNHPNYANPVANISSGAFGRITNILNSGPLPAAYVRSSSCSAWSSNGFQIVEWPRNRKIAARF